MTDTVFRMRKPPVKPQRKKLVHYNDFSEGTLEELAVWVESIKARYKDVYLEPQCEGYYIKIKAEILESEEDFAKRMDSYNNKLNAYNAWRREHAAEISAYKAVKELAKKEQTLEEIARYEKQIAALRKKVNA